jgi:hypothetical protein
MKNSVILFCAAGIVFAGCGGDNKAENAVARITERKNPGYVRVLNLTKGDIEIWTKNRHVTGTVTSMEATDMFPLGLGDQTVRFEYEGKKLEVKANYVSEKGNSIILMPDHTTKIIENEQRYATSEANIHIVPVDLGGKLPATVNFSGGDTKSVPVKDSMILLNQGSINCPDGSTIVVKEKISYSLFIVATPNKVVYILGKNASDKKPLAAGTAAA